jgi:glycosyltransferase involved in cell wall biosynthesis
MIVAYDLRYASDHFAGIGQHTFSLLESLLGLDGEERYRVLWDPRQSNTRFDFQPFRTHPRVDWVEKQFHPISPFGALQVGAWLRRERPGVYFSPFGLRPIASGCPEVLTLHDVAALRTAHVPSLVSYALYRLSLVLAARASRIIAVSEFSRREIIEVLGVPSDRVVAILCGISGRPSLESHRRPEQLREGRFALVVGDNRPRKNLAVIAKAWSLADAPTTPLVAIGPVDPRFPAFAELLGTANAHRLQHLGWVRPEELEWLYRHAEIVLLPSMYEGFGLPLLEAMAAGTPPVVSDIPVFREVGGDGAVFAPPNDPEGWARAVNALLADAGARGQLRAKGLARAAELTYRATAEKTLAVLREVARRP